ACRPWPATCSRHPHPLLLSVSHRLLLERSVAAALPAGPFRQRHHAARAKFLVQSVSTNPRAKSLHSLRKASCASAVIVVAVCEDGSPLASLEAKPRSEVPASIPADAPASVTLPPMFFAHSITDQI